MAVVPYPTSDPMLPGVTATGKGNDVRMAGTGTQIMIYGIRPAQWPQGEG
jgi:hypothetical protein